MAKELTQNPDNLCRISPSVRFETAFKEKYGLDIKISEDYKLPDGFESAEQLNTYVRNIDRYNDGRAKPYHSVIRSLSSLATSMVEANPRLQGIYRQMDKNSYSHLSHLTNGVSSRFSISDIEFYNGEHFYNLNNDNHQYKLYLSNLNEFSEKIGVPINWAPSQDTLKTINTSYKAATKMSQRQEIDYSNSESNNVSNPLSYTELARQQHEKLFKGIA